MTIDSREATLTISGVKSTTDISISTASSTLGGGEGVTVGLTGTLSPCTQTPPPTIVAGIVAGPPSQAVPPTSALYLDKSIRPVSSDPTRSTEANDNAGLIAGGACLGALWILVVLAVSFRLFRRHCRFRQRTTRGYIIDPYSLIESSPTDTPTPPLRQPHASSLISQIKHIFKSPASRGSLTPSPFRLGNNGSPSARQDPSPSLPQHLESGVTRWKRKIKHPGPTAANYIPPRNTKNRGEVANPFRDSDIAEDRPGLPRAQETGDALDRLQQLTREVGAELQTLDSQAQSGQLSGAERERLDEIRRTARLAIMSPDSRPGRPISTGSTTMSASPPSYCSDCGPTLP